MKKSNICDSNNIQLWPIIAIMFFGTIFFIFAGCTRISDSNRSLLSLQHPSTGETLTLLILGGISDDHTYLIQGNHETLDIPDQVGYLSFKDSFGITYDDSSWVVYHLGEIIESHQVSTMNLKLHHISRREYRILLEKGESQFVYRYVF